MAPRYIFGGDTGLTPEQVKQQRELAAMLAGGVGSPRNIGEGLTALGYGIASRIARNKAAKAETAGRASASAAFDPIIAAFTPGTPASVTPPVEAVMPAPSSPAGGARAAAAMDPTVPDASPAQFVPGTPPGLPDVQSLIGAATGKGSEWMTPGQQSILGALLQMQMQQYDPMYDLNRRKVEAEIAAATQGDPYTLGPGQTRFGRGGDAIASMPPEPTDIQQDYNLAVEQAKAAGLPVPSFTEWGQQWRRSGATSNTAIVEGNKINYPDPPKDWDYLRDQAGNVQVEPYTTESGATGFRPRLVPMAGGETDIAQSEAAEKKIERGLEKALQADTVLAETANIRAEMKASILPPTGTTSRLTAQWSGSGAGRVRARLGLLNSSVAIRSLMRLKELSETGASGFGALNRAELQLLLDAFGTLDQYIAEPDIFLQTLDNIDRMYMNVVSDVVATVPENILRERGFGNFIDLANSNLGRMTFDQFKSELDPGFTEEEARAAYDDWLQQ